MRRRRCGKSTLLQHLINDESIYKYLSNPEAPYTGIFQAETHSLGERTLRDIERERGIY